jgi:hypothetical protein
MNIELSVLPDNGKVPVRFGPVIIMGANDFLSFKSKKFAFSAVQVLPPGIPCLQKIYVLPDGMPQTTFINTNAVADNFVFSVVMIIKDSKGGLWGREGDNKGPVIIFC